MQKIYIKQYLTNQEPCAIDKSSFFIYSMIIQNIMSQDNQIFKWINQKRETFLHKELNKNKIVF